MIKNILKEWYGGLAGSVLFIVLNGGETAAKKLADAVVGECDWVIGVGFGTMEWRICPYVGPFADPSEPGTRTDRGWQVWECE